jgi:hypothetical protein
VAELAKIRAAGDAVRGAGMRFNAGHALNYFNVQPVAALPGVRELHIGHAIVSRAVFVGMREAVRQMKAFAAGSGRPAAKSMSHLPRGPCLPRRGRRCADGGGPRAPFASAGRRRDPVRAQFRGAVAIEGADGEIRRCVRRCC